MFWSALLAFMMCSVALATAPGRKPGPQAKYIAEQLKHCEEGVAASCYNYGYAMSRRRSAKDKATGEKFIRRACTLAYAPACKQKTQSVTSKKAAKTLDKDGKPQATCFNEDAKKAAALSPAGTAGQQVTRMDKGSLWERAGLLQGDVIKSINGKPFSSTDQISQALEEGDADIEVDRQGTAVSLSISCPE